MIFALWDMESNNLVAQYGTLDEALDVVLRGIERNGDKGTESLILEDDQGEVSSIASGTDLVILARQ